MDLFFNAIKGQFNSLNFFILLLSVGGFNFWKGRKKVSMVLIVAAFLFFVLTSTAYLPTYLIEKMESRYAVFDPQKDSISEDCTYIHVLGGGYVLDARLPGSAQLSYVSLGRLSEALRIAKFYDKSILVLSGNVASGNESMALVSKKAAILLGFDSTRIALLETPATTLQEAVSFVRQFGAKSKVILVTDAIHMPRAMSFFISNGVEPIPAPTNFLKKKDNNPIDLRWIPSVENMLLMDRIYREWLGSIKGYILGLGYFSVLSVVLIGRD